jgi:hypothetical protein
MTHQPQAEKRLAGTLPLIVRGIHILPSMPCLPDFLDHREMASPLDSITTWLSNAKPVESGSLRRDSRFDPRRKKALLPVEGKRTTYADASMMCS